MTHLRTHHHVRRVGLLVVSSLFASAIHASPHHGPPHTEQDQPSQEARGFSRENPAVYQFANPFGQSFTQRIGRSEQVEVDHPALPSHDVAARRVASQSLWPSSSSHWADVPSSLGENPDWHKWGSAPAPGQYAVAQSAYDEGNNKPPPVRKRHIHKGHPPSYGHGQESNGYNESGDDIELDEVDFSSPSGETGFGEEDLESYGPEASSNGPTAYEYPENNFEPSRFKPASRPSQSLYEDEYEPPTVERGSSSSPLRPPSGFQNAFPNNFEKFKESVQVETTHPYVNSHDHDEESSPSGIGGGFAPQGFPSKFPSGFPANIKFQPSSDHVKVTQEFHSNQNFGGPEDYANPSSGGQPPSHYQRPGRPNYGIPQQLTPHQRPERDSLNPYGSSGPSDESHSYFSSNGDFGSKTPSHIVPLPQGNGPPSFDGPPPSNPYGPPPSNPYGGPPSDPYGPPPSSPYGDHEPNPYGAGPPPSAFGAPPSSPYGGPPSGDPYGPPPSKPFGGPSSFGGPPSSPYGAIPNFGPPSSIPYSASPPKGYAPPPTKDSYKKPSTYNPPQSNSPKSFESSKNYENPKSFEEPEGGQSQFDEIKEIGDDIIDSQFQQFNDRFSTHTKGADTEEDFHNDDRSEKDFKYNKVNYREPISKVYSHEEPEENVEYGTSYGAVEAYKGGFESDKPHPAHMMLNNEDDSEEESSSSPDRRYEPSSNERENSPYNKEIAKQEAEMNRYRGEEEEEEDDGYYIPTLPRDEDEPEPKTQEVEEESEPENPSKGSSRYGRRANASNRFNDEDKKRLRDKYRSKNLREVEDEVDRSGSFSDDDFLDDDEAKRWARMYEWKKNNDQKNN